MWAVGWQGEASWAETNVKNEGVIAVLVVVEAVAGEARDVPTAHRNYTHKLESQQNSLGSEEILQTSSGNQSDF